MNEEILIQKLLENLAARKQEVYKFNVENKLTPTEVKMENAYKAGYIKCIDDIATVLIEIKKTL